MNFLDHSNETLNEPLKILGALNSRKPCIIGWTMGLERVCPKALIFCNKDMTHLSFLAYDLVLECVVFVIVKVLPLSIDFSTPSLNFPYKVNHSPKKDLESLSNELEYSLNCLWNA
jgi:hypothetical protein